MPEILDPVQDQVLPVGRSEENPFNRALQWPSEALQDKQDDNPLWGTAPKLAVRIQRARRRARPGSLESHTRHRPVHRHVARKKKKPAGHPYRPPPPQQHKRQRRKKKKEFKDWWPASGGSPKK